MLVVHLLWELHIQVAVLENNWLCAHWVPNYDILNTLAVSILVHLKLFLTMIHSTMLHKTIVLLILILAHMVVSCSSMI
jgi:hypothetical protein